MRKATFRSLSIPFFSTVLLLFALNPLLGQATLNAGLSSSKVGVRQQFTVTYTLQGGKSEAFERPPFQGFRLLGQSSMSGGGSMQMYVNGQLISGGGNDAEQSWTFTLMPTTTGTFDIPAARAKVNGSWISSPPLKITVTGNNQNPVPVQTQGNTTQNSSNQRSTNQSTTTQTGLNSDDVIILAHADKQTAWTGEPIIITYKLLTRHTITSYGIEKIPSFDGFWSENIIDPTARPQQGEETYNGKRYATALLRKIVVYPQKSGTLSVEPLEVEAIVRIPVQRKQQNAFDWMDQMFNNFFSNPFGNDPFSTFGNSYEDIQKTFRSNSITLNIKELPAKNRTASFTGQLGNYTMEAWFDKERILIDDALNFNIKISGNGNMSLLEAPAVQFPGSFEVFDPQVEDNTKVSANGISGNKTFTWLIIPREPGTFKIPAVEFTFFSPAKADYITLKSDEFQVQVVGQQGSSSSSAITETETDIRFIKTEPGSFRTINSFFFASGLHFVLFLTPLLLFVIFVIVMRRRIQLYSNQQLLLYKKATRTARKRLKKAAILLKKEQYSAFYEETARAIWAYLAHRFSIQQAELSVDRVISQLSAHNVNSDVLDSLKETLDFCEYIRFAPGATSTTPGQILDKALNTIGNLEQHIQHNKRNKKDQMKDVRLTVLLILMLITGLNSHAQKTVHEDRFKDATQLYTDGQFFEAIGIYEEILQSGVENFETYYNLGNAYFKTNQLPEAVYYYEKALQTDPRNEDAQFNLRFVNSEINKEQQLVPEAFHVRFANTVMKLLSPDEWAIIGIVMFSLSLITLVFFLLQNKSGIKKLLFYLSLTGFLLTASTWYFGNRMYSSVVNPDHAIIMVSSAGIKSSPDIKSADVYVAQAGTKVKILSKLGSWYEVRVPDGNKGWISADAVRLI
jgi:tetratricopeptide (TPR) repeat protein